MLTFCVIINGKTYLAEFSRWTRIKEGGYPDGVVRLSEDNLRAQFSISVFSAYKGKQKVRDVYHTLDDLLLNEECMSCDRDCSGAFFGELFEISKALNAYKGRRDVSPLRHSVHDEDVGFYPRQEM